MAAFGLIGYPLSHSFSKKYFEEKFEREGLNGNSYRLHELKNIAELPDLIRHNPELRGLNVTIPYKQAVIPYLDHIDPVAAQIGAVNTIKIGSQGIIGFNTDWLGFRESLLRFLPANFSGEALILGTGGSSKAVQAALNQLNIAWKLVSRNKAKGTFSYSEITKEVMASHLLIINTTPLGMYPAVAEAPDLPYSCLTNRHFLFDLIYNPAETLLLRHGAKAGAKVKNGLEMLQLQADAAWEIWIAD